MDKYNEISCVETGSPADRAGLVAGDIITSINGCDVYDVLQYKYLCADTTLDIEVSRGGIAKKFHITKEEYEDPGLEFTYPLMSKAKGCANKCIFCFIDQLPPNMRKTLYFKDDDSRLSFLHGNYVTLTNLSEREIKNIGEMKISPINVSVHTTDPKLREFMIKNKNAGKMLDIMKYWEKCGIVMNAQIVLCKGINDGAALDKTIADLAGMYPSVTSVSVVPVGITKYRDGLYPLEPYDKQASKDVVNQVDKWQDKLLSEIGSRFIFAADEFYLKAEEEIPPFDAYEDFPQIENGVGLIASMQDEFDFAIEDVKTIKKERTVSIATGKAAFSFIKSLANRLEEKAGNLKINVYGIENTVFGENITVAGLLCGRDIITQLKDKEIGQALYITTSMLRAGENVLLDDVTTDDLERELGTKVIVTDNDGFDFVDKLTKMP